MADRRNMSRRVDFAGVTDDNVVLKTYPQGIIRGQPASFRKEDDINDSIIAQLFTGSAQLDQSNINAVFELLIKFLDLGAYSVVDDQESVVVPTQDSPQPTCLEAYSVLHTALRFGPIPRFVLDAVNNLSLNTKRDFLAYKRSKSVLDLRVTVQILRVVDYLLYLEDTANLVDPTVVRFFLSEAIVALDEPTSSKAMIGICIHMFNNIHQPQALSSDIASKLLNAMSKRPSFNSAALNSEYLACFRVLLQYHRTLMMSNATLWIPQTVQALFDTNSFVRQQALAILNEINRKLASSKQISKAIFDEMDKLDESEEPFALVACRRMIASLNIQGEARSTMAIWSGIVLSLISWGNSSDEKVENWKHLSKWLEVTKPGFNSVYLSTKEATINAWKTSIYIFAFNGRSEHAPRNLQALLHPFKLVKVNPSTIVKRFCGNLNALLYIATRVSTPAGAHFDVVWSSLVVPALQQIFDSQSPATHQEGVRYLKHLLTPSPTRPGVRNRVLQSDIELDEVGSLPQSWIVKNTIHILDFVSKVRESMSWEEVMEIWNVILDVSKQAVSASIQFSDETLSHIASLGMFLLRERSSLTQDQLDDLAMSVIEALGIASLSSKRYTRTGDLLSTVKSGTTSMLAVLLSLLMTNTDASHVETVLSRLISASAGLRRSLYVLRAGIEYVDKPAVWSACASAVKKLTASTTDLHGEDLDNFVAILFSARALEGHDESVWSLWVDLLEKGLDASKQASMFVDLLSRSWPSGLAVSIITSRPTILWSFPEFGTSVTRIVVSDTSFHSSALDVESLPEQFRVQLARQLILVNNGSSLSDFQLVMELATSLLGPENLVGNADVYVAAVRSNVPGNRTIGLSMWLKVFCSEEELVGRYSDQVVMSVSQLYAEGRISAVPSNLPLLASRHREKRPAPGLSRDMSPPPTSPSTSLPSSPTENLSRVKRQRISEDLLSDCMTPPISSDEPGVQAMELFNQLHATRDRALIESISEQSSFLVKPEPVPDLWAMDDLASSPPPSGHSSGHSSDLNNDAAEQLSAVKKLMGVQMRKALRAASDSECTMIEKMLMEMLVAVRIHQAEK